MHQEGRGHVAPLFCVALFARLATTPFALLLRRIRAVSKLDESPCDDPIVSLSLASAIPPRSASLCCLIPYP